MSSLTSYHGVQALDPDPVGDGGLAIQNDLKSLVDWIPHKASALDPVGLTARYQRSRSRCSLA